MISAEHAEELQIGALLRQYFYAIDARDEALLRACFALDATAHYHKGFATEVLLQEGGAIARFLLNRVSVYSVTNHLCSNLHIAVNGDVAHSAMHAIAHCVIAADSKIVVRGIRYEDHLVRKTSGWCIKHRIHTPQWQYEVIAVPPAIPVHGEHLPKSAGAGNRSPQIAVP